jgi:hypothetical protein
MLARAFSIGLSRYEFLGSREAWKHEWTAAYRNRMLLQAFARSPAGSVERAAFAYGRPAVKRLLALRSR